MDFCLRDRACLSVPLWRYCRRAVFISLVFVFFGLSAEAAEQPFPLVSAAEIGRLAKDRAPQPQIFIDASPQIIQQRVRLTDSLRFDHVDATKHLYPLSATVVVYDFSLGGSGARETARAWANAGYKFVYIFRSGFAGAREAKLAVDATAAPEDALPYTVSAQSLSDALKQKEEMVLVDLRSDIEFSGDHLPEAINLKHAELLSKFDAADKTKWIVLYDSLGNSLDPLIWQLRKAGYLQAVSLVGGYKAWADAQSPKPLEGR